MAEESKQSNETQYYGLDKAHSHQTNSSINSQNHSNEQKNDTDKTSSIETSPEQIKRIRKTSISQSNAIFLFSAIALLLAIKAIQSEVSCASESLCQNYHGYGTGILGFIVFILTVINAVLCDSMMNGAEKVSKEFHKKMIKRKIIAIVLTMIPICIIVLAFLFANH